MHQLHWFSKFAHMVACAAGRSGTFVLALVVVIVWAATGPIFQFSDTWQLVINTGTTIVTFLMVFLLQHTQNRDTLAIQIKLDELIRAVKEAHNDIIDAEHMDEEHLADLEKDYQKIAKEKMTAKHPHKPAQIPPHNPAHNSPHPA